MSAGRLGLPTLIRYVIAAGLARTADAGAAVGLVLLAVHNGKGGFTGGALAACLTAPHLAGPFLARYLDRSQDARVVLALSCVGYGVSLAAAAVTFGHLPILVPFGLVAVAGSCGPILTGGLSSQLSSIVAVDPVSQRRSQGWDAITYGVAGTLGPAAVAALAAAASARAALVLLAGGAVVAAGVTLRLPLQRPPGARSSAAALPLRQILGMIAQRPGLRRVTVSSIVTSLLGGGVAVLAVGLGVSLGVGANAGAELAAAFGLGSLLGSIAVTIMPLRGEADALMGRFAAAIGVGFVLCGLVPGLGWAVAVFAVVGFLNGPFFAATLAARTAYSPPTGQAQVFVTMAALKVGCSALGTAGAGLAGQAGARAALIGGGILILLVIALLAIDRARNPAVSDEPARL